MPIDEPPPSTSDDEGSLRLISREALAVLVTDDAVQLVEALGPSFFADARLPGAINLPPDRVDAMAPRLLPDSAQPVVVYCSRTCTNAEETARHLLRLGYRDVRVFAAGKEDWVEAGLPVERDADPA
ncbi:rhodanese-like domain-containing protein [Aquihabitans daechungensis]|uniref:rhodanese-like domain-containing protein n=1 Tax=Aquihabitans daechungensis TaxID=1052257 RepID=UPI003BA2342A